MGRGRGAHSPLSANYMTEWVREEPGNAVFNEKRVILVKTVPQKLVTEGVPVIKIFNTKSVGGKTF